MQKDPVVFDHIHLHDVQLKMQRPGTAHGTVLLDGVTAKIPLGKFYVIKGQLPQVGKGIGRGLVLEVLCGMRLADKGVVGVPPQVRSAMLTSDDTQFFDKTVHECLTFGNPNPKSLSEETITAACKMAGLNDELVSDRNNHKVGKGGKHLRVVDRASLAVSVRSIYMSVSPAYLCVCVPTLVVALLLHNLFPGRTSAAGGCRHDHH